MSSMQAMQELGHGHGHDYAAGSPHIKNHIVRSMIVETLQESVREIADRQGFCRVLEVGAGHGTFTDHLLAAGATVELTEMSNPAADRLRNRFRHNPAVTVVNDADGSAAADGAEVDLVVCISVLQHISDYLAAVASMTNRISTGGAFISFQDPIWYDRRSKVARAADRGAYLAWRATRGDVLRGVAATLRRTRGVYDESNPADMVEYHVLRDGVDEIALQQMLTGHFGEVFIHRYWTAQSAWAQAFGARVASPNTFGIVATGRRSAHPSPARPDVLPVLEESRG